MEFDVQKYMDAHIKRLDEKIDQLLADTKQIRIDLTEKFVEVKAEQKTCRRHCEEYSSDVSDRITSLERQAIASETARKVLENMNRKEVESEDLRAQKKQWFWIKFGAFITGMMIVSDFFRYFLDKVWR